MAAGAVAAFAAGCSPALDWREFEPEGAGLRVTFPCRPDRVVRDIPSPPATLRWTMLSCATSGQTFALGYAELDPSERPSDRLTALRQAAAARAAGLHLRSETPDGSIPAASAPATVSRSSPGAFSAAAELSAEGRGPDGRTIVQRMRFFAIDRRIYQATIVGESIDASTIESFLDGMRPSR